jgi:uncharacterized protein (TIGR03086 family)
MQHRSGELLDQGFDFVTAVITKLSDDDWARPTPCEGWDARDLLGHLTTSVMVAISTMKGTQPVWPDAARPGDLVEGDPLDFWRHTVAQARDVLAEADLTRALDSPLGSTVGAALAIPVIDLYIHAWDFGAAHGVAIELPAEIMDYAHAHVDPIPDEVMRGPNRAFAPQTTPPPDATPTERFIAWTGREVGDTGKTAVRRST